MRRARELERNTTVLLKGWQSVPWDYIGLHNASWGRLRCALSTLRDVEWNARAGDRRTIMGMLVDGVQAPAGYFAAAMTAIPSPSSGSHVRGETRANAALDVASAT